MKKPVPIRNEHASRARILERLIIHHKNGLKWVRAGDAIGPATRTGPWAEDLLFLVQAGWVESEAAPSKMGDDTRVRLPAMTIVTVA